MYIAYWNLRENPFQNVADTRFAYLSNQHKEGLARLLYLIDGRKLGGILCGPYGVGKSMILELMAEKTRDNPAVKHLHVDATPMGVLPMVKQLLSQLGHKRDVSSFPDALDTLQEVFSDTDADFEHAVMAVDEAQLLRDGEAFEFLHLLSNLRNMRGQGRGETAVTIILAGHHDLLSKVREEPAFCQRMQLAWQLDPLSVEQTVEYVHHRMRAAGGDIWVFDEEAIREVHHASGGLPRHINNICDISLLLGCASKISKIDRSIMQQAISEVNSPMLRG